MLYNALHHRWSRLIACVIGELITAWAVRIFIVPLSLYTGGIMGVCQLMRTFLQIWADFDTLDIAGILYFAINILILLFSYRNLGRNFVMKTLICTAAYSGFYSMIPSPTAPVIDDYLTACLLGGILSGIGSGIVLTCGGSSGGLDIIGLCLSKRRNLFTIGRFSLLFNAILYTVCLFLFSPEIAIYSVIYNFVASIVLDRAHQQNVNVQALIFTRSDETRLARFIIDSLGRSVTWWQGTGAYTHEGVHVLCVCLSKYEIEELLHAVHSMDPHAFLTVQEGVHIYGNFPRKLDEI